MIDKFSVNYKSFQESIYSFNNISEIENLIKSIVNDLIFILILGIGSYLVIKDKLSLSNLIIYQKYYSASISTCRKSLVIL